MSILCFFNRFNDVVLWFIGMSFNSGQYIFLLRVHCMQHVTAVSYSPQDQWYMELVLGGVSLNLEDHRAVIFLRTIKKNQQFFPAINYILSVTFQPRGLTRSLLERTSSWKFNQSERRSLQDSQSLTPCVFCSRLFVYCLTLIKPDLSKPCISNGF